MFPFYSSTSYPAFVPAFVDWRHSAGRRDNETFDYDVEKVKSVNISKIQKQKRSQAVKAHTVRMKYANQFVKFRNHVLSEFEESDVPRPAVELLGSELEPDSDLVYVDFAVNDATRGKFSEILDFVVSALQDSGLDKHFHTKPIGSKEVGGEASELRREIIWVFAKPENPHPELETKDVDFWNVSGEEEGEAEEEPMP